MFEKSVVDAAHSVTVLSSGQFAERLSTPLHCDSQGEGSNSGQEKHSNPRIFFPGKREGAETGPDI